MAPSRSEEQPGDATDDRVDKTAGRRRLHDSQGRTGFVTRGRRLRWTIRGAIPSPVDAAQGGERRCRDRRRACSGRGG